MSSPDMIIIGAGSAGMMCAIHAALRGKRCLVMEKSHHPGGTLHLSAGHLSGAGTRRQKMMHIEDSPDLHFDDIRRISRNTMNPVICRKAVTLASSTIDWLEDHGYTFAANTPAIIYGHEPYSVPRTYFSVQDYSGGPIMKPGKAVLNVLLPIWNRLVQEEKIFFQPDTRLTGVEMKNYEVTALRFLSSGQSTIRWEVNHKPVVLTTGGYASNPELFARIHFPEGYSKIKYPCPERLISSASITSDGSGLQLASEIGAIITGAEKHISTLGGLELEPQSGRADFWTAWARVSNAKDRPPREIYVNDEGKRFMNEWELSVDARERKVLQQPHQRFWVIFDEASLQDGSTVVVQWNAEKLKEECLNEKVVWQAPTLSELAQKTGLPESEFLKTIEEYNRQAEAEKHNGAGKSPIKHPPFYALLTYAFSLISFAGLLTNEYLQIMHQDGKEMKNFFAAGEILGAGSTSGNAFCGGMLLTPALSFGKWLGENL
ncbi:MAG: FAD-dependent oxidoreductase [Chitinophagaceae bacterium]|nr:FAD-dependent oxidoreductase [Chitinophagaceae bacterium]